MTFFGFFDTIFLPDRNISANKDGKYYINFRAFCKFTKNSEKKLIKKD